MSEFARVTLLADGRDEKNPRIVVTILNANNAEMQHVLGDIMVRQNGRA